MIINPGSGPVTGANPTDARANMDHLAADVAATGATVGTPIEHATHSDGRYAFTLRVNGTDHEVEMPGLPLTQVRYIQADGQSPWDFPRLYIDGSSWLWHYAVGILTADDSDD